MTSIFKTRQVKRGLVLSAVVLTLATIGVHHVAADVDPDRALFDDDETFRQLSNGGQMRLLAKFGPKADTSRGPTAALSVGFPNTGPSAPLSWQSPLSALSVDSSPSVIAAPPANILVNNPNLDLTARDTQSETTLVLGAGSVVVSGYNDSGSFIGSNQFTGWSRSTNGGATFTDMGKLPLGANGDAGDPVLARDTTSGTIYFATLQFTGSGLNCFRSFDNGATFAAPAQCAPGTTGFQDKEWITVDNAPGPGRGNVYVGWRDFGAGNGIKFSRSTDGGATYNPVGGVLIATGGQGAFVVTGPDHAVYVFWYAGATLRVRKSTDQGLTFGAAVIVANLITTGTNGDLALNGGFRSNSFPLAVANPANPNQLYVAFNDCSSAPCSAAADHGNIFMTRSTDGGATWLAPVKVNDDIGTRDQFIPAIGITPNGKSLFISFYDRRNSATNTRIERWGVQGSIAASGAVSFDPNQLISTADFPSVRNQDPVVNTTYMGDYDQVVANNTSFLLSWGDNRLANPNFAAHVNQPDVRCAVLAHCFAPVIGGASASPNELSPPNHKMVPIAVSYNVTGTGTCPSTCTLSVASNEPINGLGDGNTSPDWQVVNANLVNLRAERSGIGSDRVYTITITCTSAAGPSTKTVTVTVPHNQ